MSVSLVTGADGFVGQHLLVALLEAGDAVIGTTRQPEPQLTTLDPDKAERVTWVRLELEDRGSVRAAVRDHPADRIFHLAGLASVADSLDNPEAPLRVNAIGTLFLLEELAVLRKESGRDPAVLISGSAQVYGAAANRFRPLTEVCPLEPLSPYAVSKAAQELLGRQSHRAADLAVILTRSFNHTGPGQSRSFVAAELAARVREIRGRDGAGSVKVGNAAARRDFTDVRDVVRAYVTLTEKGEPGEIYNVCSGRSYSVEELLRVLADVAGVQVEMESDPRRRRRVDIPELVGSYAKLEETTGWAPRIDLRASLGDLLEAMATA